jgi:urease accessory protein
MQRTIFRLLTLLVFLIPTASLAHTGHADTAGFAAGFLHPLGGLDHVLAMVAVGILAYQLGGRALWLLPLAFVVAMGLGGALGAAHVHVPFVEAGIAISIVVLGAAIFFGIKAPAVLAAAIAGLFALFHGYAHGAEMPLAGSAASYAAGFMLATALLHLAGIGVGVGSGRLARSTSGMALRTAGLLIAVIGAAILTQSV